MRVVLAVANPLFAGPAARSLAAKGHLKAIVRPGRSLVGRLRRGLRRPSTRDPLDSLQRECDIPVEWVSRRDGDFAARIRKFSPDVLCVMTFPWLLGPETLAVPRVQAINVHPSILPRHRGPNPFFWLYHEGDDDAGFTVHSMTPEADAGHVWSNFEMSLPRGHPVQQLHDRLAVESGRLLPGLLEEIVDGTRTAVPQDETAATVAPRVDRVGRMIAFDKWPTARVWHLLRGMHPKYRERLTDESGRAVDYRGVGEYRLESHRFEAGTVTTEDRGWRLWCSDGHVHLTPTSDS